MNFKNNMKVFLHKLKVVKKFTYYICKKIMPYKKITGIYKILNNANNKCYIGSAISIYNRFSQHKRALRNNCHFNAHLQSSWNKYGENLFSFIILEKCEREFLLEKEENWIKTLKTNNNDFGYNKRLDCRTNLGRKFSEETKNKLRLSHLGHKRSKETQEKISNSQYKPVIQMDMQENFIQEFPSMLEAEKVTGIKRQNISMTCRKIIPHSKGFKWTYKNKEDEFRKRAN